MRKTRQAEINWMACALIQARDSEQTYAALLDLLQAWPEHPLCAIANKLAPATGAAKDRASAIEALQQFSQGMPRDIATRVQAVGVEIAEISNVFRV